MPCPSFAQRSSTLLYTALLSPLTLAAEADNEWLAPTVIAAVVPRTPLIQTTDPKAPRTPVPASDGADYLKTFPGFAVIRNGGSNGDPVLRGLFGSRLNILTNGSQLPGACPNRMDTPTAYIAPASYDHLTVIKGPQSVQWGPGASAGSVLFEHDPAGFDGPGLFGTASVLAGSNGRLDKTLETLAGSALGYARFNGNTSQADDYRDGAGDRVPSRWRKWNSDLALGYTPNADTLLELSAGTGDGEARYAGRGMDGAAFRRESLGLRFKQQYPDDTLDTVEAQLYYSYADHVMNNYSLRAPAGMARASNPDRRTLGGRLKATWQWEQWQLVSGLDGQTSEHRRRSALGEGAYRHLPREKDASLSQYGAFSELTRFAGEHTRWIGGVRLDHAQAQDLRPRLGDRPNPTANASRSSTLPSGFLRWEHDLRMPATLYAGLGHVQRFPDYWELFSPGTGPAGSHNAFDGLRPEKTTQLDVGAHYNGEDTQAWISAYAGVVQDFILFNYDSTASTARNVSARIAGAELGVAYTLSAHWSADASLAYAWGENRSDGRPLPQMPPLDARLGLTWQHQPFSVGALWRLVSAQTRIDPDAGNVAGKDFQRASGFAVLSLNTAYRASHTLTLSAGIDNLFNKAYAEHLNRAGNAGFGYPAGDPQAIREPGRTLWTKVDWTF